MISVVQPTGAMSLLSQLEAESLSRYSQGDLYDLYRNCSLAVLNSGTIPDNSSELLDKFRDFEINVIRNERGVKLEMINPPQSAFVDGTIISSIQNNLCSVLRDIVKIATYKMHLKENSAKGVPLAKFRTNEIFNMLRHAESLHSGQDPNIVVCWGGHAINKTEYDYAFAVGRELGLREFDICTGCGPGAMEAPMAGAVVGYAMQKFRHGRFIGLTEPSIIAAEPPNPFVNELVILHDIEKRLEAFVRFGHTMIIFPGGPGTAEELLYILAIKLRRENRHEPLPLILTAPKESAAYMESLDNFVGNVLGDNARRLYRIIIDDPIEVAREARKSLDMVREHRTLNSDAYCFNWSLEIPEELQEPFEATHENMASLNLHRNQEPCELAAALRRAFSGIVAGNVKEAGMKRIAEKGPFIIKGDQDIMSAMDQLLTDFVAQKRFMLSHEEYVPCYKISVDEDQS